MKRNRIILRVCVITSQGEELECLLPFMAETEISFDKLEMFKNNMVETEISFNKLEMLKNNKVNAYYYSNNTRINITGTLHQIFGIIIAKKKKSFRENNESGYKSSFSVLEHIVSITSEDTAAQLATTYGGMRIYIPKQPKENHPLAQLIGWDNLQAIIHKIGDGYMVIPAKKYRGAGAKAELISKLLKENKSVREVAQIANCCERTVWLHKSKQKILSSNTTIV